MTKPIPQTDFEIYPMILNRWSPRFFNAELEITPGQLLTLLDAARLSASCFNEQPWRFAYALRQEQQKFQLFINGLLPANQTWAKQASAIVFTLAKKTFTHNGKVNKHAIHDVGLAVGNITYQAMSMGIYLHQMAGVDFEAVHNLLNVDDDFEVISALAIGYILPAADLNEEDLQKEYRPQKRKALSEIILS